MENADPFLVVKDEVEASLKQANTLFSRWQQLLQDPASNPDDFEWTTNELKTNIKSIEWDLEDLQETISVVEASPTGFKITPAEIQSRKKFIGDVRQTIKHMRDETTSKGKSKMQQDKRSALLQGTAGPAGRFKKLDDQIEAQNQDFIGSQDAQQQEIMKKQDHTVDQVQDALRVLTVMGTQIGQVVDEHNEKLDDFGNEIDSVQDKMAATLKKLDRTLNITKDGKQSCCICLLLIILVILIVVFVA